MQSYLHWLLRIFYVFLMEVDNDNGEAVVLRVTLSYWMLPQRIASTLPYDAQLLLSHKVASCYHASSFLLRNINERVVIKQSESSVELVNKKRGIYSPISIIW